MTEDRMGQLYVSWEALRQALRLPDNTDLVEAKMDHITGRIILYLRSPDLPPRHEAAYPLIVNAEISRIFVACGHAEDKFLGWVY